MSLTTGSARKRVCIVSPFIYPLFDSGCTVPKVGGSELQLFLLARELTERGHEVHIIVDDYGQPNVKTFGNITLHKVPLKYMGGSNFHLIPVWCHLVATLYRINADVHVLKLPRSIMPPMGLYCRLRRKTLIFVGQIDSDVDLEFLRKAEGFIAFWFYRFGMHFVTATVAQNELQAKGFRDIFKKPTTIIRNAVAVPEHMPDDIEKSIVLWVGRNQKKKHPELFAELVKRMPQHQFVMIMIPEQNQDDSMIRDLAQTASNFEFKGFLPFHEAQEFFFRAKVYVCTSDREGFPNVFLQAWQAGCPVVSLTIDPDDVITTHDLGRLSGDLDSMTADIDCLMTNDDLHGQMAANGTRYIEEHHALKSAVDKYEAIFQEYET